MRSSTPSRKPNPWTSPAAAADLLSRGEVVAIPTETVYGLAANALDAQAVARIFELKQRPHFDPLIVHAADAESAWACADHVPPIAKKLADAFWPGPLSLVVPKHARIPDIVTSGLPHVALRVPSHPVARDILRRAAVPLAAPSANPFGRTSPTTAQHVRQMLGAVLDHIVDGGPCQTGVESTVVAFTDRGQPVILRQGGLTREQIESVVGPVIIAAPTSQPAGQHTAQHPAQRAAGTTPQPAPGMLDQHYATRTPLRLVDRLPEPFPPRSALLTLSGADGVQGPEQHIRLSDSGDLREAAAHLFAAMHDLDAQGQAGAFDQIIAIRVPDAGLGAAINDRLQRASAQAE